MIMVNLWGASRITANSWALRAKWLHHETDTSRKN